jgi:Ca2+-transporting ATPase
VPEAVAQCRRAGIRVVMITGDFPGTALNIARQAGIDAGEALSGDGVAALDDAALAAAVRRVNVFARVRPEQKLRLVQAYRAAGEVVAMTGDGVNDAPALKAAHIGVAMGRRGTDVAREAAALVITDDNFASIVDEVRLGRRIFDNIRPTRATCSRFTSRSGTALSVLLGWPLAAARAHRVPELIIDPACSIAFEAEPEHGDTMRRPPRTLDTPILARRQAGIAFLQGALLFAAVLFALGYARSQGRSEEVTRALAFWTLVIGNLTLIVADRSMSQTLWQALRHSNRAVWIIVSATLATLALVLGVPALQEVFHFAAPSARDLLLTAAVGIAGVLWIDLLKVGTRNRATG